MTYRTHWHIRYDPMPCPGKLWAWWHEDYDGAPLETGGPPGDDRCGWEESVEDCKREIDRWIEDNQEEDDECR